MPPDFLVEIRPMRELANRGYRSEITRYLIAGFSAFAGDLLIFNLAISYLALHYLVANFLGFLIGLVISYSLNISWVFSKRKYRKKVGTELLIFVAIVVLGLAISELSIFFFIEFLAYSPVESKILTAAVVMIFNFLCKKLILFSTDPGQNA